jgi:hypothetical protein
VHVREALAETVEELRGQGRFSQDPEIIAYVDRLLQDWKPITQRQARRASQILWPDGV